MRLNPALMRLTPFSYCGTNYPTRLDANESCVPLSQEIKAEIAQAVREINFNSYPDDQTVALRAAYGRMFSVDPECVVPGNGSDELINMIVGRLIPYGGVVLGVERDFGSYWSNAEIFGRRAVKLPRDEDLTFSVDDLLAGARQHDADLILFSNPNNPSGREIPRAEVIRLIETADCLVVVDEAYMDFSDQSVLDLAGRYENLIVLRTLSKAMGLAGARVGFAVSNPSLTYAMRSVRDAYNVSAADQAIATVLLSHPEHRTHTLEETARLMRLLKEGLDAIVANHPEQMVVYPTVTNFVLISVPDADKVMGAMHAAKISLRQLDHKLIRISAAPEETQKQVLRLLEAYFETL